jgi:surface antigen
MPAGAAGLDFAACNGNYEPIARSGLGGEDGIYRWLSDPRRLILVASLALLPVGVLADPPAGRTRAHAARPSVTPRTPPPAADAGDDDESSAAVLSRCEQRARRNLERLDHLGDRARAATERLGRLVGASQTSVAHAIRIGHSLSEVIARRLDCHEQQQAALATDRAITGGVGRTATWTSDTRAHVSGSSVVTAQDRGGSCVTVTDIIIIDGEETRAPKRMCRRPPTNRFVRV